MSQTVLPLVAVLSNAPSARRNSYSRGTRTSPYHSPYHSPSLNSVSNSASSSADPSGFLLPPAPSSSSANDFCPHLGCFQTVPCHFHDAPTSDDEDDCSTSTGLRNRHAPVLPSIVTTKKPRRPELWLSLKLRLDGINHVEQTFEVNGWLNMWWVDPNFESRVEVTRNEEVEVASNRLGTYTVVDDRANQPLNVQSLFENAIQCELLEDPVFRYNPHTQVVSETLHFTATLSEELELDRFPFDRQYLTLRLCLRTTKFKLVAEPPAYIPDGYDMRTMVSYTCSPSIAGWTGLSPVVGNCKAAGQSDDLRITFSLRMERHFTFWLYNVVFLLFCIVSLTPITFAIAPDATADRMSIILTLLLTIVTFKFMILSEIPKTSTITLFDKYLFASYGMLFFAVGQTIVCWVLPDTWWHQVNWGSAFLMAMVWVLFHAWIVHNAFAGKFSVPWSEMKDEGGIGTRHAAILVQSADIALPIEPEFPGKLLVTRGSMASVLANS